MEAVGPYRVVRELGRGAMGVVFEAFDPAIGRTVAVKVIRSQPLATAEEDAQLKMRFAREASAAGRLSHPNIGTIHQLGEQDGLQYLVMERIQGTSLDAMLAPAVPLSLETTLRMLAQVASALDYAHADGIVHRDIKPANILVKGDGTVKLTDFGIARITSQTVTQTGATMGTPAYMAPEQIMASKVYGRADQFSLAVMAYQMLAGKRPFEAPTDQTLLFQIVSAEPCELETVQSRYPPAAGEVLKKALSKKPEARYPTCTQFVDELTRTLTQPAVAEPREPIREAAAAETDIPPVQRERPAEPRPAGRSAFAIVAIVRWTARVAALALGLLYLLVSVRSGRIPRILLCNGYRYWFRAEFG